MANGKSKEVVTTNSEYTNGFVAGAAGHWFIKNPHIHNSFEWMSWTEGWIRGREYYLDEGWPMTW